MLEIVRVFLQKGKLAIYVPYEVKETLGLKENDELQFMKFSDNAFIIAKEDYIAKLIAAGSGIQQPGYAAQAQAKDQVSEAEIIVLKKLDELRYPQRTPDAVAKILNQSEKAVLQDLIKRKYVTLIKDKSGAELYSISNSIYNKFLMRKKPPQLQQQQARQALESTQKQEPVHLLIKDAAQKSDDIKSLEKNGYVVLPTEVQAASISLALEESIRQGLVIGTRAFNKKFYILLRQFFDAHASRLLQQLKDGPKKISDLAQKESIDIEAARGIAYILAESGEVSEVSKDTFKLA
ncbi:MAG: hypothetical protein QW591_02470 [Candidatus Micrarchaeaceae archaeon]